MMAELLQKERAIFHYPMDPVRNQKVMYNLYFKKTKNTPAYQTFFCRFAEMLSIITCERTIISLSNIGADSR